MDPIFIESRLESATVYGNLARVSREGRADLNTGVSRIAWPDLPGDIDPAAVRVETDRGQVRVVETEPLPVTASKLPERSADQLRTELHELAALQEALRAEIDLLDHVTPSRDGSAAALRPDLFMKGLTAITERRRKALTDLRKASAQHAEVSRALERAEADAREQSPTHRQTLMVTIESADAGPALVRVTYASGWATWRPLYHLQLSPGADRVELVRYGDVWQDTGEDWSQVSLRLSTAEPESGLRLPTVRPWILKLNTSLDDDMRSMYRRAEHSLRPPGPGTAPNDAMQPDGNETIINEVPSTAPSTGSVVPSEPIGQQTHIDTAARVIASDLDAYATQFDDHGVFADVTSPGLTAARMIESENGAFGPPSEPPPPTGSPGLVVPPNAGGDRAQLGREPEPRDASGGIDVEIEVARPFDAKSGSDRHRVQLGRRKYPLQLWYVIRPGLRDHAFGRAEIINQDQDPILAGPTSLFVGGAFFGHTRLSTTPGRGKLVLDLGAETSIKCARRSETNVRREGLINKDEVHAVDVTIDIESFLAVPVNIKVEDQVPVATDPHVRVRLLNTSPADAKLDDETGLVTFETRIGPQSKLQLTLSYEVGAPAGYRLSQGLANEVTL